MSLPVKRLACSCVFFMFLSLPPKGHPQTSVQYLLQLTSRFPIIKVNYTYFFFLQNYPHFHKQSTQKRSKYIQIHFFIPCSLNSVKCSVYLPNQTLETKMTLRTAQKKDFTIIIGSSNRPPIFRFVQERAWHSFGDGKFLKVQAVPPKSSLCSAHVLL